MQGDTGFGGSGFDGSGDAGAAGELRKLGGVKGELVPGDFVAFFGKTSVAHRGETHGEVGFLVLGGLFEEDENLFNFAGSGFELGEKSFFLRHAVDEEFPVALDVGEIDKIVVVANADASFAVAEGEQAGGDGLREMFEFPHRGVRDAVGGNEAVADEVGVVRGVSEVAAVGKIGPSVIGFLADAMIEPFPDEAALDPRLGFEEMKIVRERAVGIAHGMGIFAKDDRAFEWMKKWFGKRWAGAISSTAVEMGETDGSEFVTLEGGVGFGVIMFGDEIAPSGEVGDGLIHRADDIGAERVISPGEGALTFGNDAFVMDRAGGFVLTNPCSGSGVTGTVAGFVAERPKDDRRVIFVADDHTLGAVEPGQGVAGFAAKIIVEIMGLGVGLVDNVEAVFVAKVEPTGIVGIMRGADGVEVELLHQGDVLDEGFVGDGFAKIGVVIVAVDAFDEDALTIDQKVAFSHFDVAKTDARAGLRIALGRVEGDDEGVKEWVFVGPQARLRYGSVEIDTEMIELVGDAFFRDVKCSGEGFFKNGFACRIVKLSFCADASGNGAGSVNARETDVDVEVEGGFA